MSTANSIKKIRMSLFLNQKQFAEQIGSTCSSISCYESGSRFPSFHTIQRILDLAEKNGLKINIKDIRPE